MGFLVPRIVVVFENRPLTIQGADWPAQLLEKDTNGSQICVHKVMSFCSSCMALINEERK